MANQRVSNYDPFDNYNCRYKTMSQCSGVDANLC